MGIMEDGNITFLHAPYLCGMGGTRIDDDEPSRDGTYAQQGIAEESGGLNAPIITGTNR